MEMDGRFRGAFARLLADQDLADLDGLMEYRGYFDELPLYSTYPQIAFLAPLPAEERNRVLIRTAAAHLDAVLHHSLMFYAGREHDHFCAVAITEWDEFDAGGLVTPRFWYANPSRGVFDHLVLDPPTSGYSAFVADCLDRDPAYALAEERTDEGGLRPRVRRVFVRHSSPSTPPSDTTGRPERPPNAH